MSSKKKMIIAISAFAMVVLAAVVAVVAVLAASSVTVKSSLTINYTVSDVVADVEVYAAKVTNGATTITWGTANTADFGVDGFTTGTGATGTVGGTEASMALTTFALSKTECVVLKFVFNNNSSKAFTATLGDISTSGKNVNIFYSNTESGLSSLTSGTKSAVNVAAGADESSTYYVRIAIADTTADVSSFAPEFKWTLA